MKNTQFLLLSLIVMIISGCADIQNKTINLSGEDENWKQQLSSQIKQLGHRNWIVVADAAYPLQSNPGITTILSTDDHLKTIGIVNDLIQQQLHIKPILYLDKEVDFVSEEDAPGIGEFKTEIDKLLGANANKVIHEDIIKMLDEASKLFNVVIIKTDFAIPYTSVFFQLDCKYWSAKAEQELRNKISKNE
ncbi:hypothetical protein OAO55_00500 [Bacteroidales bacterium]|nr:hypothetical protein [Bacteroidales bacterium]